MAAGIYNFTIPQGGTFNRTLTVTNDDGSLFNFTGYSAKMQFRASDQTLAHELTTENGGITLGGSAGTLSLHIGASDTETFDFDTVQHDLKFWPTATPDDADYLVEGVATLDPRTTQ